MSSPAVTQLARNDKPPYRVPLMSEIRALPWNGLKVASTFAGGGGSSTGYRMAGYRIAWANEIVPSARDSYAANKAPETVLDGRDIRAVQAADILAATGLAVGELDVFDGSPPCVSFSTAGKREKGWGRVTQSHDVMQRQDDLFYEYARLLNGLQPRAFVAENVSGLIKGTAKGYFLEILRSLRACGYRVEAQLLDAQWLGVPQMRQRLIFMGIRSDVAGKPAFPAPLKHRYTVRDALPDIAMVYDGKISKLDARKEAAPTILAIDGGRPTSSFDQGLGYVEAKIRMAIGNDAFEPKFGTLNQASPSIMASGARTSGLLEQGTERRKFTIDELKRICGFPDDYILTGSYADQWARCGNAVPPVMMSHIAAALHGVIGHTLPL